MDADGSGNKRPTEKSEQKTKEEQHTASRLLPVRMLSSILWEGCFLKAGWSGQAANCAPSRKNQSVFSTTCQYPSLSGPTRFVTLSAFSQAICFPTTLFGKSCCTWCVVLKKHSEWFSPYFLFLLLFCRFLLTSWVFILLLSIVVNDIQKFVCKFDVCNFYNTIFFCWIIKNIDADISNGRYSQAARLWPYG